MVFAEAQRNNNNNNNNNCNYKFGQQKNIINDYDGQENSMELERRM